MSDNAVPHLLSSANDGAPNGAVADDSRSVTGAGEPMPNAPAATGSEPRRTQPRAPMIVFAYDCLRREFEALTALRPTRDEVPAPDDVHRMRIATRRLRIALRLFRRMLPARAAKGFRAELRWFAHALGGVRDLDVYAENFREYLEQIPPEELQELGGYELHLRRARAEARSNLGALFGDPRYAELLASFGAFLHGAPTPAALRRWRSFRVRDGIQQYLQKSLKRVIRLGRKIDAESRAKRLHRLRIRAKRLRYELEFFADAYPSLGGAAKATKLLQDTLGAHQDAATAMQRLEDYARTLRPPGRRGAVAMPAALARLLDTQERKAQEARGSFVAEWERFAAALERTKLVA